MGDGSLGRLIGLGVVPLLAAGCSGDTATDSQLVEEAKAVIASHEDYAEAGDLEGVMTNVHPGVLVLTVDAPLVVGAEAFREFYAGLLSMGTWRFTHDYEGENVIEGVVELFGVARGTLTLPDGSAVPFANNFLLQLRRGEDGTLKVWRASFAPTAQVEGEAEESEPDGV